MPGTELEQPRAADLIKSMSIADIREMHADLLEHVEELSDDQLTLLEALELRLDAEAVTRFPKAEIIHQGTPGIVVAGELLREVEAVVLAHKPRRGLFSEEERRPLCSSMDGVQPLEIVRIPGTDRQTGPVCATCPMNAWGSASFWKPEAGAEQAGKACTEKRLVGLLIKGRDIPVLLFVPPTSLRDWEQHLADMRLAKKALVGHYTRIRVERQEAGGRTWGTLHFSAGGPVEPGDVRAVYALKRALEQTLQQITIEVADESVVGVDEQGNPVEGEVYDPGDDVPPPDEPIDG